MSKKTSQKQRRKAIFKRFEEGARQSEVADEFHMKKQNVNKMHAAWQASRPAAVPSIVEQMTDKEKRIAAIFSWERRKQTGDTQESIAKSLSMKQPSVARIIRNWKKTGNTEERRKENHRPPKYDDVATLIRKARRQLREKRTKASYRGLAKTVLKDRSKSMHKRMTMMRLLRGKMDLFG
jgi:DNA-binding MarR family transcriptional regulator